MGLTKFRRLRPTLAKSGRARPKLARFAPSLAETVELCRYRAKSAPIWETDQDRPSSGPISRDVGPNSANVAQPRLALNQIRAELGLIRPGASTIFGTESARLGPSLNTLAGYPRTSTRLGDSAKLERLRPSAGQSRPNWPRHRTQVAHEGLSLARLRPHSARLLAEFWPPGEAER